MGRIWHRLVFATTWTAPLGLWLAAVPVGVLAADKTAPEVPSLARGSLSPEQATDYATGLLLILVLLALLVWAARWMQNRNGFGRGGLRVLSSIGLGGKERLMVVDVDGERLLIGVAPGGVALLRTLDARGLPPVEPKTREDNWLARTLSEGDAIVIRLLALVALAGAAGPLLAQPALQAIVVEPTAAGGESYSLTLQALALMTVLTLLPAFLLMMTSFTRIVIVLAILRQAIGTVQTPSNQIVIGLALFLTMFIMSPVFERAWLDAIQPYMAQQLTPEVAIGKAIAPFREFMLGQIREGDLTLYMDIANVAPDTALEDVPFSVLMPAFVTSELKTAFQIGFLLFIPFLIIDLIIASVLMSMGMMMLSPMMISLPFKLMLFVLVDGWSLTLGTLASSFGMS